MTVFALIAVYLTPSIIVLVAGTALAVLRFGSERRSSSTPAEMVDTGQNSPTAAA